MSVNAREPGGAHQALLLLVIKVVHGGVVAVALAEAEVDQVLGGEVVRPNTTIADLGPRPISRLCGFISR